MNLPLSYIFLPFASSIIFLAREKGSHIYPRSHGPASEELTHFTLEGFNQESSLANNPEEMEAAMEGLHKDRPESKSRSEPNGARSLRYIPPPPLGLYHALAKNELCQLQNHGLFGRFNYLERAKRASKDSRGERYQPPPLLGAQH